jgi:hypothetical protein
VAVRITDRDRDLLAFLAEHRFVLREQLEALLGVSAAAANARLLALRRAGLVRWQAPQYDGHSAGYQIRARGLGSIGSPLSAPRRPDPRGYAHDVGLAWLWLAATTESFGAMREVVSERQMRSHDGRADDPAARIGIRLGGVGRGGRERRHYPDLLLRTATGHTVAIELELSRKGRTRLETILAGYGADRRVDAVLYLVSSEQLARQVKAAAARLGVSSVVHLQRFAWGGSMRSLGRGAVAQRRRSSQRALAIGAGR